MTKKTDKLYKKTNVEAGSFRFDRRVAEVFDDMIARSVPGYAQILSLLPTLTRQFQHSGKNYYDLGCSTGAGLVSMTNGLNNTAASLIGIDNSTAMIEEAKKLTTEITQSAHHKLELICADLSEQVITDAAMVLMNFTLQFIPMLERNKLIKDIYDGLIPGGALVLSEKVKAEDTLSEQLLTRVHHQYKADQGYSELEISNKRDAIENVLIPETLSTHENRLKQAGFEVISPWIRNLQFVSILAVK